jgi:hypothetical protein
MEEKKIILENSLQPFFFEKLKSINEICSPRISNEAVYYSSIVLEKYIHSNSFYDIEDGKHREKILGIKLLESGHLPKKGQIRLLKDVGDTALMLCGYFNESLNKKIVDQKYYQDIGRMAYNRLDGLVPSLYDIPAFYGYLADSFDLISFIFNRMVDKLNQYQNNEDQFLLFVNAKVTTKVS